MSKEKEITWSDVFNQPKVQKSMMKYAIASCDYSDSLFSIFKFSRKRKRK